MKLKSIGFLIIFSVVTSNAQQKNSFISIKNNLPAEQKNKIVSIAWPQFIKVFPTNDTSKLTIVDAATKAEIPFQFEKLGSDTIHNLLIQISVPAKKSVKLLVFRKKHKPFVTKTFGRFVPERKDDFAWENDKIAFRMYGKALEKTPNEMAYGIDVWVKRTDKMIINERYKRGEYHFDHGNGLDYYHVGFTLGAGNMAPFVNDSIHYSKNYVDYKILDNGPLRTSFQLYYDSWLVGTKEVKTVKTISLDAGSQLNKINVKYSNYSDSSLSVVAGITTRLGKGVKYLDEINGIMSYWEPEYKKDGITGVACIFNSPVRRMIEVNGQLLAKTTTNTDHSITYFTGAAWNKAQEITSYDLWSKYLNTFQQEIKNPLEVVFQ